MSCSLNTVSFLLIWSHLVTPDWLHNGTTIDDKHYDDWNDLAVMYYNWGTDESNTTPVFIEDEEALKNVKYKFMYNGGSLSWNHKTTEEIEEIDDWKKALTWALGIKGVDIHGRIYPYADCMGTLVHPKIIMTLCACVNSFYVSYYALKPGDTGPSNFKTSITSDEQFDIRAPNLVASRTSWAGFEYLSGETEKFPISKRVLESPHCHKAVFAVDNQHILQQYKSAVFLKVDVPINHPFSPVLLAYYNFTEDHLHSTNDYYTEFVNGVEKIFRFRKQKVQFMAYFQEAYSQQKNKPNVIELVQVNHTGEAMDFGSQLMGTEWKEVYTSPKAPNKIPQRDAHKWLYTCSRKMFEKFAEALNVYPGTDVAEHEWFDDFESATMKPDVACFSLEAGLLCNAPPGSPVVINATLIGMTITRVTNCTKITLKEQVITFVLMMAQENNGLEAPEQIAELAANLYETELLEEKALSQDLVFNDNQDQGDVDLVGSIDRELVAPMAKFIKKNEFLISPPDKPKHARSFCAKHKTYFAFLLLMLPNAVF